MCLLLVAAALHHCAHSPTQCEFVSKMVVTANQLKSAIDTAIGEILAKTSETAIKKVIGSYTHEKSAKENIDQLKTHSRNELSETHKFLKNLGTDYPASAQTLNPTTRTIPKYAEDIVNFIEQLKPTLCTACNENYVPTREDYDEDKVKCFLCKRPSHHECYKEKNINPEIGIIFLCSECLSVNAATELSKKMSGEDAEPAKKDELVQPDNEKTEDEDKAERPNPHQPYDPRRDADDCPLYLKRICPHGLTGKREIDGRPCPFKHRRLCVHFRDNGPEGCRYGRRCKYFHPDICQNSLNLQACFTKDCPDFHLRGTKKPNKTATHNNPAPPVYNAIAAKFISPWDYPTPELSLPQQYLQNQSNNKQKKQPSSTSSDDFLVKQMESRMDGKMESLLKFTSQLIKETIKESLANQQPQNQVHQEIRSTPFIIPNVIQQNQQREENLQQVLHQQYFPYGQMMPMQQYQAQPAQPLMNAALPQAEDGK